MVPEGHLYLVKTGTFTPSINTATEIKSISNSQCICSA